MCTTNDEKIEHLNAEFYLAFAMVNLATLTHDYQIRLRCRKNACDIYRSVTDLLSRWILEDAEQQSVRKRLDELRQWLELSGGLQAPDAVTAQLDKSHH